MALYTIYLLTLINLVIRNLLGEILTGAFNRIFVYNIIWCLRFLCLIAYFGIYRAVVKQYKYTISLLILNNYYYKKCRRCQLFNCLKYFYKLKTGIRIIN